MALPKLDLPTGGKPVIIAVVDDGFRLSHTAFRDFLHRSYSEYPPNRLDDDGDGYADDYCGWDVADDDNDVSLPEGRESTFYHGTYLCGVITDILIRAYGPKASDHFKILPVKVIADAARQTYISHGYQGVAYALAQKADIILCAWNGGGVGAEEARLFERARAEGALVVASAGNFYSEKAEPPASNPAVVAVAAVDSLRQKIPVSNFGMFVDLSGPGQGVVGASSESDRSSRIDGATSAAAGVTAACLAILRREAPEAGPFDLLAALKNTAAPLDAQNLRYAGKLGSGFPNLSQAVAYLKDKRSCCQPLNSALPEGMITERHLSPGTDNPFFQISPAGNYNGVWFDLTSSSGSGDRSEIQFFTLEDSLAGALPMQGSGRFFVPGNGAKVAIHSLGGRRPPVFQLNYFMETIDSSRLFCRDTRIFENESGVITDGSDEEHYANACDCRWQINAPEGYRILLRFTEFDTQARVDFVYLFDGDATIPENMIAKFSGPNIPPEVVSRTNQVLVWFVPDAEQTAKGWKLEYRWVK